MEDLEHKSNLDEPNEDSKNLVIAIVKLRSLKFDLDTKFYVCGKCDKIDSHPDIPRNGVSPFRIFWSSVIKYQNRYFKTDDKFSIKFEKIVFKTFWRSQFSCIYQGTTFETTDINSYIFEPLLKDFKFYQSEFREAILLVDALNYPNSDPKLLNDKTLKKTSIDKRDKILDSWLREIK